MKKTFFRFVFWLAATLFVVTVFAARGTGQAWVRSIPEWIWFAAVLVFVVHKLIVAMSILSPMMDRLISGMEKDGIIDRGC